MKQDLSKHIHRDALHHAYCISGVSASGHAPFFTFLEKHLAISTHGNPDFWHGQYESLGIDEARTIKEMQQRSAANVGAKKVFVISTDTITHEAQNALLKVFEDPTADTHFFLLMPSVETLLPTLRSRLVIVPADPQNNAATGNGEVEKSVEQSVEQFLAASKGKRMTLIKPLVEEKDKRGALAFVDALIKKLSKSAKDVAEHRPELEELLAMRSYLSDRSASIKMILEYLCITLK
ncbi:MAG: hypothetical protein WCO79_02320 [bacterium]